MATEKNEPCCRVSLNQVDGLSRTLDNFLAQHKDFPQAKVCEVLEDLRDSHVRSEQIEIKYSDLFLINTG